LLAGAFGGNAAAALPAGVFCGDAAAGLPTGAFGGDAAALLAGAGAPGADTVAGFSGGLAAVGAARAGSVRRGVAPRWPPLGGGFDSVTADYPRMRRA
jgi:hypothetical protein